MDANAEIKQKKNWSEKQVNIRGCGLNFAQPLRESPVTLCVISRGGKKERPRERERDFDSL